MNSKVFIYSWTISLRNSLSSIFGKIWDEVFFLLAISDNNPIVLLNKFFCDRNINS